MARTRTKQNKTESEILMKKTKKIEKKEVLDNKISIKKTSNEKEIVAEFPLIRNQHNKMVMSIPVYRKDRLDFTPGFCLLDEFTAEFRNEQQLLQEYRIASETSMVDVASIKEPKPSSRNSYCTICKIRFEDYKEHISLESHQIKMKSSPYCKYIEEMIEKKNIERFLKSNENEDENKNKILEEKNGRIFEFECEKEDKVTTSDSKESLYEKISKEFIKYKQISTQPQNNTEIEKGIFDVLDFMC